MTIFQQHSRSPSLGLLWLSIVTLIADIEIGPIELRQCGPSLQVAQCLVQRTVPKYLGFWEGHLGVKNSSFEPKWRNAAPGTYRHEGREAVIRCNLHRGLLSGHSDTYAAQHSASQSPSALEVA